jgi:uncharacterized PurR-regulated membrane protein YhhQ (DUF165 family)
LRFAILTGAYVAIVCTAQVAATKIVELPIVHKPMPAATYLIGIALTTVELAHYTAPSRREAWRNAQAMIATGFAASALLAAYLQLTVHMTPAFPGQQFDAVLGSTWRIVAGSLAAFAISESVDNSLGAWLRGRAPDWARVVGTNLVSAPLDSLVFIGIAFGLGSLNLVEGQFYGKMAATVLIGLPLVYAIRRFVPERPGAA